MQAVNALTRVGALWRYFTFMSLAWASRGEQAGATALICTFHHSGEELARYSSGASAEGFDQVT